MKNFVKTAWRILWYNKFALLLYEISYRIASTVLVVIFARFAIDFTLEQQKISYITAENFGKVVTDPWTIFMAVIGAFLLVFLVLLEITALFSCFEHSYRQEKMSMPHLWRDSFVWSRRMLRRHPFWWFSCILLAAPFLCIHLVIREASYVKLITFTMNHIYKMIPHKEILFVFLALLLLVSFGVSFLLPVGFFERGSIREVLKKTNRMVKYRWKRIMLGMVVTQILILVLSAVIYILSAAGVVLYAMATKQPGNLVSAVVVYGDWLKTGIGILIGSIALVLILLFLFVLYSIEFPQIGRHRRIATVPKSRFRQMMRSRYMIWSITALILLVESGYLVYAASAGAIIPEGFEQEVQITAHRGGARMAPENTLSALEYSIESLSDYAEIDVQETKDGELVLLHDTSLRRTTGLKANIWDLTLAEVKQLDAGIKFHKSFRGEEIPTLEEAIESVRGKLKLNIEVKYNGHNKNIIKKVVKVIEDCNFVQDCVLTSMNYSFLEEAKNLNPDIRTGYILRMTYGDVTRMEASDFFSIKSTYVNPAFVRRAHTAGKQVHAWTVNYQGDIKRMIDCNVDNIITDDPELVRKVLNGKVDSNPNFWVLMKYAIG